MLHPEEERRHRLSASVFGRLRQPLAGNGSSGRGVPTGNLCLRYHDPVPTYHVENFGCRATQADGAALERQFEARGLNRAAPTDADFVVLNSCTVTASADQDARAAIRRVRRQNPLARIIVTGCYAQRAPQEVAALPGVTAVIGNSHKHQLAEIVLPSLKVNREGHDFGRAAGTLHPIPPSTPQAAGAADRMAFVSLSALTENAEPKTENLIYVSDIFAHTELLAAPIFESAEAVETLRTRPNLKVQEGCGNRCSFCIIPSVRGHSRSLPLPQVIREMNALVAAGYREVVISGINLGRWGRETGFGLAPHATGIGTPDIDFQRPTPGSPKPDLAFLVRAILAHTQLEKLRISSVEPMDWTRDLIALIASSPRVAKHAHLPLQSASDSVLRRMNRKYRPWHYREKIEEIRAAMPTAAIGADVMTGFPGETDADFEATRRFIEDLPFTYLHVFTYSARPGTPAASLPHQVPVHVARERNHVLRDLAAGKKLAFMRSFVRTSLPAITLNLVHSRPAGEFTEALTDNYLKLYLKGRQPPNRWIIAPIHAAEDGALVSCT